jgi:hypothetical protein
MKKLTILLFSILISFSSYAKWTEITSSIDGDTHYMNTENIKEHNGYSYWWELTDYLIPTQFGDISTIKYVQVNCETSGQKALSLSYYKHNMGKGTAQTSPSAALGGWRYFQPDSVGGVMMEHGCNLK